MSHPYRDPPPLSLQPRKSFWCSIGLHSWEPFYSPVWEHAQRCIGEACNKKQYWAIYWDAELTGWSWHNFKD